MLELNSSPRTPGRPTPAKAYQSDMDQFRAWCAAQRPPLQALPAEPMTVALYLAALAEVRKPATIRRRMDSISAVSKLIMVV